MLKFMKKLRNTLKIKILEIGAGGGYLYHYLKKVLKVTKLLSLAINKETPYKKFKIKTYPTIDAVEKKYDIVIIVSVLEHVTDPINFLKNLKLLLKNRGKVII